jgi:hypothetical protein
MSRIRAPKGGFTHGASGYKNYQCRCERCRAAHAAEQYGFRAQRAARLAADPTLRPHGDAHTYHQWKCRCRPCKDAWAARARAYASRQRAKAAAS